MISRSPRFRIQACALLLALALPFALLTGCGTSVQRVSVNKTVDLSGAWNDTDSRLVSDEMVQDVTARPWIANFQNARHHAPAVIVGEVRNLSNEHINTNTFVGDLERALVNSGQVDMVASSTERQGIREERKDQDLNASEASRKAAGNELGADFMLTGSINTITDVEGSTQVRYYQVDLTLISLADNRKVWIGQKKIKKIVERSKIKP
jgi:uncharacterized protein (TIGR02722 family)